MHPLSFTIGTSRIQSSLPTPTLRRGAMGMRSTVAEPPLIPFSGRPAKDRFTTTKGTTVKVVPTANNAGQSSENGQSPITFYPPEVLKGLPLSITNADHRTVIEKTMDWMDQTLRGTACKGPASIDKGKCAMAVVTGLGNAHMDTRLLDRVVSACLESQFPKLAIGDPKRDTERSIVLICPDLTNYEAFQETRNALQNPPYTTTDKALARGAVMGFLFPNPDAPTKVLKTLPFPMITIRYIAKSDKPVAYRQGTVPTAIYNALFGPK